MRVSPFNLARFWFLCIDRELYFKNLSKWPTLSKWTMSYCRVEWIFFNYKHRFSSFLFLRDHFNLILCTRHFKRIYTILYELIFDCFNKWLGHHFIGLFIRNNKWDLGKTSRMLLFSDGELCSYRSGNTESSSVSSSHCLNCLSA